MTHVKSNNVNIDEIEFSKPTLYKNNSGGCGISMFYNKQRFDFQTPRLLNLFGLNIYRDEKTDKIKSITITLQFNSGTDKINRVDNFLKKIKTFDNKVKEMGNKNHKKWLQCNKPIPKEALTALYKKTLYYRVLPTGETDYGIPPTFKVKLPYYNGELGDITVLNEKNESIPYDLEYLEKKIVDKCIIKCIVQPSIWIVDKKFGVTYNLKALQIFENNIKKQKGKKQNKKETNKGINTYFGKMKDESDGSDDLDDLDDSDDDDFELN